VSNNDGKNETNNVTENFMPEPVELRTYKPIANEYIIDPKDETALPEAYNIRFLNSLFIMYLLIT